MRVQECFTRKLKDNHFARKMLWVFKLNNERHMSPSTSQRASEGGTPILESGKELPRD